MLKDLTVESDRVTAVQAKIALNALAGRDLLNMETGIIAQINSEQRNKILSLTALQKSQVNGFSAGLHNAAAARIDLLWKHAIHLEIRPDKGGDANIASIKRFAAPWVFRGETSVAYLTAKETVEHGHRIYSLELQGMEKLRYKGGTPDGNTTTGANPTVARLLRKVNPESHAINHDTA